jgi:MinD superfamily P-loop ATPase
MKEILVLSGKGGTGKTTLIGSLAALVRHKVLADCDVDAADLHLLLSPRVRERHEFWSGVRASVDSELCNACGTCMEICQFNAIEISGGDGASIDPLSCEGCGVCAHFCPEKAISLHDKLCGAWFLSDTAYGPMVHAALDIGEENSGKLVSLVKRNARELAEREDAQWILVDGPPGIGCPVIASLSGADLVLVVTEPTSSGLHDLVRVLDLAEHFKLPACVCINKWDLSRDLADRIEQSCSMRGIPLLGRIPFDPAAITSLVAGKPIVDYDNGPAAASIRQLWQALEEMADRSMSASEGAPGKKSRSEE